MSIDSNDDIVDFESQYPKWYRQESLIFYQSECIPQKNVTQNSNSIENVQSDNNPTSRTYIQDNFCQTHEISKSYSPTKNNFRPHLLNHRRKKNQRHTLKSLIKAAIKSSKKCSKKKQTESLCQNIGQITKNFLAFAKNSHFLFLTPLLDEEFLEQNKWFQQIKKKDGISIKDYDRIYKCIELRDLLKEFFSYKILYRDLILSRTIPVNKMLYLHFLEIFQANFQMMQFKGISETKIMLQKKRKQKLTQK